MPGSGLRPLKVPEDWLLDIAGAVGEGGADCCNPAFMPLPSSERSCMFWKVPEVLSVVPAPVDEVLYQGQHPGASMHCRVPAKSHMYRYVVLLNLG